MLSERESTSLECSISNNLLECKYAKLYSLGLQIIGTVQEVIYSSSQNFTNTRSTNTKIPSKARTLRGLLVNKAILEIPKCFNIALGVSYLRESIGKLCNKLDWQLN